MPASGAVRLAADSRPIAGRSTQPDQKRFKRPLLNCYDDSPGRIIQTKSPGLTNGLPARLSGQIRQSKYVMIILRQIT